MTQCICGGFTRSDINPMCEIHATRENLTEEERKAAVKWLREHRSRINKRIVALSAGDSDDG